jgi:predicted AlkP superfamily phosphohydrolase/phosphomutase
MTGPSRRVLVLGLDGGTFDLLDPLMEAGELPFLRSLAAKGVRAPLRSVYPAKTIPAWYSFATGRDPGELGVFGFAEPTDEPGHSHLVRSFRPVEAFWDRLSRLGVKVGVVNFPVLSGYPLHGFVLPGMLSEGATTYPRELRAEVEAALGSGYPGELPTFRESERDAWVAEATEAVRRRAKAAASLAEHHRPGFLFALFRETDRIEHQLWNELDRPVAEIPADLLAFWRTVDAACAEVDRAFRAGGGPALTLVISDHGHGAVRSDFLTNRWLHREKLLVFRSEPRALSVRSAVTRLALAAQRLPYGVRWSRRLADWLRDGRHADLARMLDSASFEASSGRIDWRRTVAFSYPVPEGIYLNPFNPELTPERRTEVLRDIRRRLEAYPEAKIEVFRPEEIYRGHNLRRAPALLIRIDGMETEPRMDFAYPTPLIRDRPSFFYGCGTHRMNGIFIGAGEGISAGGTLGSRALLDLAPTILETMGVAPPAALAGRSFASELCPGA